MSLRVLIIDDEEDIREVARLSLEIMGHMDVSVAGSGQEGLALAQQQPPSLILLDVMLPEMDGIAIFKQLKADPRTAKIPVIFLTAKVQSSAQQEFAQLGAAGMIAKPFRPQQLALQVQQVLANAAG